MCAIAVSATVLTSALLFVSIKKMRRREMKIILNGKKTKNGKNDVSRNELHITIAIFFFILLLNNV